MKKDPNSNKSRFYLIKLFGDSVHIKVLEVLLKNVLREHKSGHIQWNNLSEIGKRASISRSSAKRIIDEYLKKDFLVEKMIETHAKNPPRYVRLNLSDPSIKELLFFYKKVRGFL